MWYSFDGRLVHPQVEVYLQFSLVVSDSLVKGLPFSVAMIFPLCFLDVFSFYFSIRFWKSCLDERPLIFLLRVVAFPLLLFRVSLDLIQPLFAEVGGILVDGTMVVRHLCYCAIGLIKAWIHSYSAYFIFFPRQFFRVLMQTVFCRPLIITSWCTRFRAGSVWSLESGINSAVTSNTKGERVRVN